MASRADEPVPRPMHGASPPVLDAEALEKALGHPLYVARWIGARQRVLFLCALIGCVALFFLIRWLAAQPEVDATWRSNARAQVVLASSQDPSLRPMVGQVLTAVQTSEAWIPLSALVLQRSPRWQVDDAVRERLAAQQRAVSQGLRDPALRLHFADGTVIAPPVKARGALGLGVPFWLLAAMSLVAYLVALVVLLAGPGLKNVLYAVMTLCQSGNLLFIAVEVVPDLAMPVKLARLDVSARVAFDLVTFAAVVHAAAIHPHRLPGHRLVAALAWLGVGTLVALEASGNLAHVWAWTQATTIFYGLAAIVLLSLSNRRSPHPFAVVNRRMLTIAVATLALLTTAVAAADQHPATQHDIASIGSAIWYIFFTSLLLLAPFVTRSHQVVREFSLLAGISTVATSLDLLFVAFFSLGQFASLTLSLFLALGAYAGVRQWLVNQMIGSNMLTTERMFERLYRVARDVEARPQRARELITGLLRELFEPLEVHHVSRADATTQVVADGSALVVPMPQLQADGEPGGIVLRFSRRGTRLFTQEDARLTDRVIEQLKRAVAFDEAVEQGRSEERVRIAQDLHDDIGARLLTLMYQAPTPEMEDYLRHTLQDLKTLTRGLAAPNHRLSHAAAEWKTDIAQRLAAADCDLAWTFSFDEDITLTVVQWSALTRVLRELVTNTIAHAHATLVEVDGNYLDGDFTLTVLDNGDGRAPQAWSHGLGLGGVRKRVKQLGGQVEWREREPVGIACRVFVPRLGPRR